VKEFPPELSVIIVCHNGWPDLRRCLASLRDYPPASPHEVIVVDNCSEDGAPDRTAGEFPHFKLLRNRVNRGFPAANNQGIEAARGRFLLFLNPDTRVGPGFLDRMLDALRSRPDWGAVGPALFNDRGFFQVSFGGRVNFRTEWARKLFLNAVIRRRIHRWKTPREVEWLSGACMMARRDALPAGGAFDEDFFLYFEDIDLCLRMRAAGWKLVLLPEVRAYHGGGGSTAARPLFSRYHYRRSQLHFYRKHNSPLSLLLLKLYLAGVFCALNLKSPGKDRESRAARRRFFALLSGGGSGPAENPEREPEDSI
jgi:GT2 family glycosyltransferase